MMSTKNKVLIFDILFLTIIAIVGEIINVKAVTMFYSGFYFSITLIIAFIAIYRWGYAGISIALIIGIVTSIISPEATMETYIVNVLGNGMILVGAFALNVIGRERVKDFPYWAVIYVLAGYLSIVLGRSILLSFMGMSFISALLLVFANEMLNIISIALLFALFTKQKALLIDLRKIKEEIY